MPDPLDYRNPKHRDEVQRSVAKPIAQAAIPLEFDTLLTRTLDHGAARAVESELKREGVQAFRSADGSRAERWIELYVRASDHPRASQVAGRIFARRLKLNSFPRQVVDPPRMPGEPDGSDTGSW